VIDIIFLLNYVVQAVLITGAGSGIGAGLALRYAGPGVTLFLADLNETHAKKTAVAATAKGAVAHVTALDVTDRAKMEAWIAACEKIAPVDLAVACAGIAGVTSGVDVGSGGAALEAAVTHNKKFHDVTSRIFGVNVMGVVNTVVPLLTPMRERGKGQIALVASLAGMAPAALDPSYSASKAAVLSYAQGLRYAFYQHGVHINAVCPGFIETPLTDSFHGLKPLQIPLERGLDYIVQGLNNDEAVVAFPPPVFLTLAWLNACPWLIRDYIAYFGGRAGLGYARNASPAAVTNKRD
jgi:NAD(P)-dependent dehydrogenase (short-subunit alcohol dehydrogenase family)